MGAEPLAGITEIRQYARRALVAAGQTGESFVDLDQVTTAVGLRKAQLYAEDGEMPPQFSAFIKSFASKVMGVLDIPEKTIYVDAALPDGRRRFTHGHEIGHDVLPWHAGAFYHDDATTLAPETKDDLEREANAFASELLFGAGKFTQIADDYAPGLGVALSLAGVYGTSAAAALRYYVEWSSRPMALVALSRYETNTAGVRGVRIMAHQSFTSMTFASRFGTVESMFPTGYVTTANGAFHLASESTSVGVGAMGDVHLVTSRGTVTFQAEMFNNNRLRYLVLTRRSRLQGRRKELVDAQGRPLQRAL
ncbi:ImmA/IrrE family metallo-endopeptidase [uncultured Microbacterium sp.]|uniref:ImmA/IrrE family metallo-endopeptidase n=1 Tax=uncultured Microbacterium sp. TaxID=191216 RepID=UPI0025E5C3FF|nr:ImmA/IrrE family metallo-endopeptidase [uncultured Microbacterium sp.]